MKGHLKKLADKRTKNLAGQFVFSKSSVTYRPPEGYYGKFGVTEHNVKGGSTSVHDEDDDIQEVDSSSSTDKVIIKKPKKGFIDNELFPDDSLDVSYDTLKNNINKSISRLEADDIDVDHIMEDDGNRDVTAGADTDRDVTVGYSDRDVTVSDADVPKRDPMNLFARNRPDPVFTDDDDYRIERTPGVINPKWRIRTNSYPIDNRGFGQHDAVLQQMTQGDEHDKHLMQVLSHVVSQSTAVSSVQNDEEEYVEEEDYEEESNGESGQSYKVISGNGEETSEDKSNSNDDGDQNDSEEVSTTSAYESANENVSDEGHPQKRNETLQATKCDVTPEKRDVTHDADDGLKSQKCDGTNTLEAQKRDATTTLEPIVITPDQVVTDSIIDLSGQVLIDANTGNVYNIDDVDVSQFTDVFIVNATSDNPLQNYQPVTLKLLDADDVLPIKKEQIDQPSVVLQEVKVHVQNGKNQGVEIIEISSESDNVSSEKRDVADEVGKSDGITEEKDAEKRDESESDGKETDEEVGKGNVVEKRDGITDNDNEKSDVGKNRDVITEEKCDVVEKRDGITDKQTDVGEK